MPAKVCGAVYGLSLIHSVNGVIALVSEPSDPFGDESGNEADGDANQRRNDDAIRLPGLLSEQRKVSE